MTRNKTSCVYYKIDLIRQMRISGKKKKKKPLQFHLCAYPCSNFCISVFIEEAQ